MKVIRKSFDWRTWTIRVVVLASIGACVMVAQEVSDHPERVPVKAVVIVVD